MEKIPPNERLASLEAKMEILLELLKEIRDDLKNNPSKEEFVALEERVKSLEISSTQISSKVATIATVASILSSVLVGAVVKMLVP